MKAFIIILILSSLILAEDKKVPTAAATKEKTKKEIRKEKEKQEREAKLLKEKQEKIKNANEEVKHLLEKRKAQKVPDELLRDIYPMPFGSKPRQAVSYKINESKSEMFGVKFADGESTIQPGEFYDPIIHPGRGWLRTTGLIRKWSKGYLFKSKYRTYKVFDRQAVKLINYHLEKVDFKVGKKYEHKIELEGIWFHNLHDNNGFSIIGLEKVHSLEKVESK